MRLKCDGTRAETKLRLSAKRTSPFKSAGASVQSTAGSRGVRISCSNVGYAMFRGSEKGTGYPLHSTASPCVTVCHHISTGVYTYFLIFIHTFNILKNFRYRICRFLVLECCFDVAFVRSFGYPLEVRTGSVSTSDNLGSLCWGKSQYDLVPKHGV